MSLVPVSKEFKIQTSNRNLSIDFFSDMEVMEILNEISNKMETDKRRSSYHKRYFLLVNFLYRSGGRIDEVLIIRPTDINLQTNTIRMKTLKQGKDKKTGKQKVKFRIIPLHPNLRDVYMQYLIEFNLNQKFEDPLFPMQRQVVDLYFKKLQEKLGFNIHAHKFRHTFAVKAIMDNVPVNVLQQWLGHSSVFTTSIYTQITGMDTSEFMERVR
jgi:integrase/recombinase XerD